MVQTLRTTAAARAVGTLTATSEGREGLLQGLNGALKTDGALRAQLAALLARQMSSGNNHGMLIPIRSVRYAAGSRQTPQFATSLFAWWMAAAL